MSAPFLVVYSIAVVFTFYQYFFGFSFRFFTGYGLFFEFTSFGLRCFGELVFSVITGTTVLVVLLFVVPLAPLLVMGTWINFFVRPLKNVRGFENYGKVCEAVKLFTSQGPKGKRLTAATALTIILAYLFLLLWFLAWFGIVTVNLSSLFLGLGITSLLLMFYFGFRIERELREYAKTFRV
ncbi:MAG: hypothetical protein Q6352_015445 [Candidatus Freyrarchaeum guaymaensis]